MKHSLLLATAVALSSLPLAGCQLSVAHSEEEHHEVHHTIVATSPVAQDLVITQQYVCQIHSCRHIEVCALEGGYLEEIPVKEGQAVKRGDLMFKIVPTLYQARFESEVAEARLAQIELNNSQKLFSQNLVSDQDVALAKAKLAKAQANVNLARAELDFTDITAPFDGIIDRQHSQQGSLIEEGDVLTTLSDNRQMWAYFNVPEARYLEYKNRLDQNEEMSVELVLANGKPFPNHGAIGAIEADFNNETGNIAFRADFPNPDGLLRHGQTGNIMIHQTLHDAIVIPQRATYEVLDRRYVFVVGEDEAVHQHEIQVLHEMEDIYVIGGDLGEDDKIILEGVRQVHDGEKVEYKYAAPEEVLGHLKFEAE